MNVAEVIQVAAVATVLALSAGLGVVGLRWLWLKANPRPRSTAAELDELTARVAELEAERGHLVELEERVDFAERLLAAQQAPERLGGGR